MKVFGISKVVHNNDRAWTGLYSDIRTEAFYEASMTTGNDETESVLFYFIRNANNGYATIDDIYNRGMIRKITLSTAE